MRGYYLKGFLIIGWRIDWIILAQDRDQWKVPLNRVAASQE
jgi:hypothetical protein